MNRTAWLITALCLLLLTALLLSQFALWMQHSPNALFQQGLAALDQKDYDQAIARFSEVLQQYPREAGYWISRGLAYYSKGAFDQAIADYTEAIRLEPENAAAYTGRA